MSIGGENCLRLCRLVDHSLRPFRVRFSFSPLLLFLLVYEMFFCLISCISRSEFVLSFLGEQEDGVVLETKEKEKELLIALSRVCFPLLFSLSSCALLLLSNLEILSFSD